VFQEPYLFHRSLLDNAAFGLRARGVPRREAAQRAREALGFTGLAHLAHRRGNQLSGGERKRAALAMALAPNPEVLLLDELTSNVDAAYRRVLEELIVKANVERGCTVVFTTHDFDQAYRLAHHVISLHEGTVIDFIPENVFTCEIVAEAGRKVARLPGGPNIELAAGEPGRAKIVLPPESLIVSRGPLESSARNHLPGVIARADLRGETVTLTVDVGVPLLARLSLASHRELGLDLGQQVVLTFKIHAVRVI
jgi:ABC-type sulfate/molybdate transport systems ATPase subunit